MASRGLNTAAIESYRHDGFVIPDFRLPEGRVAELRAALERVLDANQDRRPENLMNVHLDRGPEGNRGDHAFMEISAHPDLLDMVAALIGDDIILWGCSLFCKPAGTGLEVPWHQDGQYWPIRPLATCTLWLALDQSTPENGCMRVIPGSHRDGLRRHHADDADGLALNQVLDSDAFDPGEAHDVVLEPGQLSLHHVHLIHGSNANTSGKRRAGLTMRYMPATSVYERNLPRVAGATGTSAPNYGARPIFLMRGRDVSGRNTLVTDMTGQDARDGASVSA